MAEKVDLQFGGLATSVNPFSSTPELSASILDNCILRNPNLIEPRRGYTQTAVNASGNIARIFPWQSRIMAFSTDGHLRDFSDGTGWSSAYSQTALTDGGLNARIVWPASTTFSAPDASNPTRVAFASKAMLFTTSAGVRVLDGLSNAILDAGIPPPSSAVPVAVTSGAGGWLLNGYSVAYRFVLGRRDANNNLILSAPSQPVVLTNTTGLNTGIPTPAFILPRNYNGATFVQIYRTLQSNVASGPGDEMYLVQELKIASMMPETSGGGDATGGYGQADLVSDSGGTGSAFLGPPLYTNPVNGEGIAAANDLPPLAREICLYNDVMLYANTTERYSQALQLIGTDALTTGRTIIIGGLTLRFDRTITSGDPTTSPPNVAVITSGTASANIDGTARDLVSIYNRAAYLTNVAVRAVYLSTPDTMPGQILFVETGIGGSSFTIQAGQNSQTCWSPDLSSTGYTLTAGNNRRANRIWWAKTGIPWAVPADNWVEVGATEKAVLRMILVRSTVFVFKEDGLWSISGNAAPFVIQPFDPGLVLLAAESCAVVNNQIFCLTNRGYVFVNESGVSPAISRPIQRGLESITYGYAATPTVAYGVACENDGLAILALPTSTGADNASQQYVFNAGNPSWSRFDIASTRHGCFDPARNALCWAVNDSLYEERKGYTGTDIQDPSLTGSTVGCTSSSTLVVTGAAVVVGDIIQQFTVNARVTAVSGTTCTLAGTFTFAAANVTVVKAIHCRWQILPWSAGDPTQLKVFNSAYFAFRESNFQYYTIGFNTEANQTYTSSTLAGPSSSAPGSSQFANAVPSPPWVARVNIPQNMVLGNTLGMDIVIQQARSFWQLEAVRFTFDPSSAESRR